MRTAPLVAVVALGCTVGLKDREFQTGSSTTVSVKRMVYEVNAWDGTLTSLDTETGDVQSIDLGGEPTRIAQVGNELWVTLRAERSIVVIEPDKDGFEEVDRMSAGAEPHGIVATEDGSRVYVAVSQDDQVVEYNGHTHEELRRWDVHDDPRWLALHPSREALFVAYGFDATMTRINLENGRLTDVKPPSTSRTTFNERDLSEGTVDLHPRITGDPSISPRGDVLVAPALFVDSTTPVEQPDETEPPPSGGGYGSSGDTNGSQLSISRMNPALMAVALDSDDGEVLEDEPVMAVFVGGTSKRGHAVRGYVSSATFDPEGTRVWATMESANAVAMVDLRPAEGQGTKRSVQNNDNGDTMMTSTGSNLFERPAEGRFFERNQLIIKTHGNPAGLSFDEDGVPWVQERGDRSVARLATEDIDGEVAGEFFNGENRVEDRFTVGISHLDPEVEAGRDLFYSAVDNRMAGAGAGVSCSTCHFEGRNDGVTWTFSDGVRNTPSLAGPVAGTAPFTWTQDVDSVGTEAQITSEGRMGGTGLNNKDAAKIEAFVNWSRDVDVSGKGQRSDKIDQGAEIFYRPEVGCASCHNGARYTDNLSHDLFGLKNVNTPGLVGVAASAPYLHDGSASTLHDLLLRLRDGSMGSTASLSDDEIDALEAYLRSL